MAIILLKPLTPIWTGNSSRLSDQLRVTGLMGSLRWWWEGIVRGRGFYACDPTGGGCLYEHGKQICAACWLFGATGWSRRFRLRAAGLTAKPWYVIAHPDIAQMHQGWLSRIYPSGSTVLWGDHLRLDVEPLFPTPTGVTWTIEDLVGGLIQTVAKWGAIGAKPQNGYGYVESVGGAGKVEALSDFFLSTPKQVRQDGQNHPHWFNTSATVFVKYAARQLGDYERRGVRIPVTAKDEYGGRVFPIAYDIRYKRAGNIMKRIDPIGLRSRLGYLAEDYERNPEILVGSKAKQERHADRRASRVFVSHLYRRRPNDPWAGRICVHVPALDNPAHEWGKEIDPQEVKDEIVDYVTNDMLPGVGTVKPVIEVAQVGLEI